MSAACPPLPLADAGIAAVLRAVDCQTTAAVTSGYARLFGASGALGEVLTAVLTIHVALLAYLLLTGRAGLSLATLMPRMLALGLVLTFATSWPAYQTVAFDLLTRGPEQVASVLTGARHGATQGFAGRLDAVFDGLMEAAGRVEASQAGTGRADAGRADARRADAGHAEAGSGGLLLKPGSLIECSALILLLGTVGILVAAKTVLATLLALGPLFVIMALFGGTRGLFEGWLRTSALFAMAPMLIVLIGSAALAMMAPIIAGVADYQAAVSNRMAVMLFVGSTVHMVLLLLAFRAAAGMTSGWKLPGGAIGMKASSDGWTAMPEQAGRHASAAATSADVPRAPGNPSDRVGSLIAAVTRSETATSARTMQILAQQASTPGDTPRPAEALDRSTKSRVQGLGQNFRGRGQTSRHNLSGALGA